MLKFMGAEPVVLVIVPSLNKKPACVAITVSAVAVEASPVVSLSSTNIQSAISILGILTTLSVPL